MGGSFNPPTIAHLRLMQSAIDTIGADKGIFSPASHEYVSRKMKKLKCINEILSDEIRAEMLETFSMRDPRLEADTFMMIHTGRKYDFEMLEDTQKRNPESEIYFLIGSDKLHVISRWHKIDEFLGMYKILIARRGEDDIESMKEANPYIKAHWDSFRVFDVPEDIRGISSSLFREKMRIQDRRAENLLTEEVFAIMNREGKVTWNSITDFSGEYEFLSNFYEVSIEYNGLTYGSTEAAFQAQKCMTDEERAAFTEYRPSKSKREGKRVKLRSDWEDVKTGIMEEVVRAKFTQHEELAQRLVDTGEKILVEGNDWGDVFWGVDTRTGEGDNHLGKILMKVREELISKA